MTNKQTDLLPKWKGNTLGACDAAERMIAAMGAKGEPRAEEIAVDETAKEEKIIVVEKDEDRAATVAGTGDDEKKIETTAISVANERTQGMKQNKTTTTIAEHLSSRSFGTLPPPRSTAGANDKRVTVSSGVQENAETKTAFAKATGSTQGTESIAPPLPGSTAANRNKQGLAIVQSKNECTESMASGQPQTSARRDANKENAH